MNGLSDFVIEGEVLIKYTGHDSYVVIPECVKEIYCYAFAYCNYIKTLNTANVQKIGIGAFLACPNLELADLHYVKTIECGAFSKCRKLCSVNIPVIEAASGDCFDGTPWYDSLSDEFCVFGDGVLIKCNTSLNMNLNEDTILNIPDNVKYVAGFYQQWHKLQIVNMPSVLKIGPSAVEGCYSLEQVNMPNVVSIGTEAFYECYNLKSVYMPKASEIGGRCFTKTTFHEEILKDEFCILGDGVLVKYNGHDEEVTIPDEVKFISGFASGYYENTEVRKIIIPKALTIGRKSMINCDKLEEVEMPEATEIEECAFVGNCCLMEVSMPKVRKIGGGAFYWTELEVVNAPAARCIDRNAFANCDSLEYVDFPNAEFVCDEAFKECSALQKVNLPKAKTILNGVFSGCKMLNEVNKPDDARVGEDAFDGCPFSEDSDL